jgi:hypothetical protein
LKLRVYGVVLLIAGTLSGCGATGSPGLSNAIVVRPKPCHHQPVGYVPPTIPAGQRYLDSLTPDRQQTAIAQSPQLGAPGKHAHFISRQRVIRLARLAARSEYSGAAPASAPVTARLMTIRRFERLLGEGSSYFVNLHRKLWIVTVHARTVNSDGRRPIIYSVYTQVFDAESGQSFMYTAGCDPFAGGGRN